MLKTFGRVFCAWVVLSTLQELYRQNQILKVTSEATLRNAKILNALLEHLDPANPYAIELSRKLSELSAQFEFEDIVKEM